MKKYLTAPNVLTCLRICGTVTILFLPPLSLSFFAVYIFCCTTDIVDGVLARMTGTASDFGARLDSVADILFYTVVLIRLFPALFEMLPAVVWWIVGGVLILRLCAYAAAAIRYRRFAAVHTYLNKLTGFVLFALPFLMLTPAAVPFSFAVCGVGALASLEELILHLFSGEYDANAKSVLILARQNVKNHQI